MQLRNCPETSRLLSVVFIATWVMLATNVCSAQSGELRSLDGQWLYVQDRTEGRANEKQGPPMSAKFKLRVEEDAVVHVRPRGDERITLDGSVIEKENSNGTINRYQGMWKDGVLEYTLETVRPSDNTRVLLIQREFRLIADGLQVSVVINDGNRSVAVYRHPEDIPLPEPAKATIADMAWLAGIWNGKRRNGSVEERWSPPLGGGMLGTSRTISRDSMVAFEYLRIVERDGGLVYVAQPGGRSPTEFVLTKMGATRAVFINPRHDFPQRIVYELSDEDVLSASIGFAIGGRPQRFEFSREDQ